MLAGACNVGAALGPKLNPGVDDVVVALVAAAVVDGAGPAEAVGAAPNNGLLGADDDGAPPKPPNRGLLGSELVAGVDDD